MLEILFAPFMVFLWRPYFALFPAMFFALGYAASKETPASGGRRKLLAAAITWLLYATYEWRMHAWGKTVSNPIRVDLAIVVPIVCAGTIAGLIGLRACLLQAQKGTKLRRRLSLGGIAIFFLLAATLAADYLFFIRPRSMEYSQRNLLSQAAYDLEFYRKRHGKYPRELSAAEVAFPPGATPEMLRQFRYSSDGASFTLSCVGMHTGELVTITSGEMESAFEP